MNFTEKLIAQEVGADELPKTFKLRYNIFCDCRGWVPKNPKKQDIDKFDPFAVHFGVFSKDRSLMACSRIIDSEKFMLEDTFSDILGDFLIKNREFSIEISRLAIDESVNGVKRFWLAMFLYREMYRWSKNNNKRFWYIVVEKSYLDSLVKLFPFKQVGNQVEYQKGVTSVAALLDLEEAISHLKINRAELHDWIVQ